MSLIEVVVAAVLLGILASAVLAVILHTQSAGVSNRARVAATSLAAREIDMVREEFTRPGVGPLVIASLGTQLNYHPLPGQTAGVPSVIDGMPYTVQRTVEWNVAGPNASACTGGTIVAYPTMAVTVTVSWPSMGSVKPVVSTASLAPAKGSGIPVTHSFVAVSVKDSAAAPSVGRTVTVTGGGGSVVGTTDASGCAVLEVAPAAGAGTNYLAAVSDTGYVDPTGNPAPSKNVGLLLQGQLNSNLKFSYALAATVALRMVNDSGSLVDAATFASSQVTLRPTVGVAQVLTVTTPEQSIGGLWPQIYRAYYGTVLPSTGVNAVDIGPGLTANLDVTVRLASSSLQAVPNGTTSAVAVPGAVTDCTAAGARTVDPASFTVTPGTWTFFATGPAFSCSAGPAAVSLPPGPSDPVVWAATTLRVTSAPAGGHLWAVSLSRVPSPILATCPGGAYAGLAVDVDGARSGNVPLPAGSWYVYRTDVAADGACLGTPSGQYPITVAYAGLTTLSWSTQNATVTVTGAPTGNKKAMVTSTSSTPPDCSTDPTTVGFTGMTKSGSNFTASLGAGTWYFHSWDQNQHQCSFGGSVVVGGQSAYQLPFSTASKPVVGP